MNCIDVLTGEKLLNCGNC